LTPDALMTPFRWLLDRKIELDTYRAFLVGDVPRATIGEPLIGIQAITDGAGFAADGSWYYDHYIYGRRSAEDPGFQDTLRRISTGSAQFRYGQSIDPGRVYELREAIRLLKNAGVEVVTFTPPMATVVIEAMHARGIDFGYAKAARAALHNLTTSHHDLLDASRLGASDCEFVDGFHGGDVIAARMLKEMARTDSGTLARFLDQEKIDVTIANFSGHALADKRFQRPGEREIDFLNLGCSK